jgi:hypothetical protein
VTLVLQGPSPTDVVHQKLITASKLYRVAAPSVLRHHNELLPPRPCSIDSLRPLVLLPLLPLHIGPRLPGGSHAAVRIGARCHVARHGPTGRCGRVGWAVLADWPDMRSRPPRLVDRVCGPVLAQRPVILFPILVYFKYFLKFMQISKIHINIKILHNQFCWNPYEEIYSEHLTKFNFVLYCLLYNYYNSNLEAFIYKYL